MSEIKQIHIFDTVIGKIVNKYDPEFSKIRVYGTQTEPLFMANDIWKYLGKGDNIYRDLKKFNTKEKCKKIVNIQKIDRECNMFTKYGLIRCVSFCKNETKASIALREFIYSLFNSIDTGNTMLNPVLKQFHNEMESTEVQAELKSVDEESKGIVYFIKNLSTNNIKIGRTNGDIETRLSQLQVGNDCELKVIKIIKCCELKVIVNSVDLEKSLHEKFKEHNVRGEWYNIPADVYETEF
jgi:hypothetical protein